MLTITDLIAVVGLAIACFSLGFTIGRVLQKTINRQSNPKH